MAEENQVTEEPQQITKEPQRVTTKNPKKVEAGKVHFQNFRGVASRVPWGWRDSFGKMGNLAGWVMKVCLKCTEKLG